MRWSNLLILGWAMALQVSAQQPVYQDASQPIERRVNDLISRLTQREKISLLSTNAPAISHLKIPEMNGWAQSLHGIVWTKPTTMFPTPIGMAATWDPQLVRDVTSAIGDEGRAIYNYWPHVQGKVEPITPLFPLGQITVTPTGERIGHNGLVYRSPVINMGRDPRWGRIWETFGEDPYLSSSITVAYVKGMQGDDPKYLKLAATLKHFAVNEQERDRTKLSAVVSEGAMRSYYFAPFQAGVQQGHAQSLMSSYNAINGMPSVVNRWLLTDVLRENWHFDGFVVPDTGAVEWAVSNQKYFKSLEESAAKSILAGSDLDTGSYSAQIPKALADGLLKGSDVDLALRHVLTVRFRLGEFDPPELVPYNKLGPEIIDSQEHRQLALKAARESIVLLANRSNLLPLDKSQIKTIAVIGPFADIAQTGAQAGYTGLCSKFVKPLDGLKAQVNPHTKVLYARGSGIVEPDNPENPGASLAYAASIAKQADVAILFVGINELLEREDVDREYLNLPEPQLELIKTVQASNPKTVVVLLNGGPVSFKTWTVSADPPALLDMFWAGEEGGTAIANVIFGDYNPAGRLPYTVYGSANDVPAMSEYEISKGFTYMYFEGRPTYAFGHGLSYSQFDYSELKTSSAKVMSDGQVKVEVAVKNSGKLDGDEVVQLYLHNSEASAKRPRQQLAGFQRVMLKAGEERAISFNVNPKQLAYWDSTRNRWALNPGTVDVMVGSASDDIRQKGRFEVTSAGYWPAGDLTLGSSFNY
jgi:beta-glucosidase